MAEQKFELKVVGVDYVCDRCNKGHMLPNSNSMLMSDPPKFQHACNNPDCKNVQWFTERYPTVRHERVTTN